MINWINIFTFYLFYGKAVSSEITNYKIVKLGQPFEAKCVAGENEDHPKWLFTRDPDCDKCDLTNCKFERIGFHLKICTFPHLDFYIFIFYYYFMK